MLKIAVPLSFVLFCLICKPSIAETNDDAEALQSESDKLLELENILLGQLERGSDTKGDSLDELTGFAEPAVVTVPSTPKIEKVPEIPQTVPASERITEELRKENARLAREIRELNSTISSLRQNLRLQELNSKQYEALNPSNSTLTVQTTKSPTVLRTSPSKYASRVYSVDAGEMLKVTLRRGNWYLVQGAGLEAWLPKEDVVEID